MSRQGRIGLVAVAVAIAVAAFVIAKPDDEEDTGGSPAAVTETGPGVGKSSAGGDVTGESEPPPRVRVTRIELRDHAVAGGPARIEARKGELVQFRVASDVEDEIHVHGYDVTKTAAPGRPARFRIPATIEGIFEVESHEAEHAGRDPLIARLVVNPS